MCPFPPPPPSPFQRNMLSTQIFVKTRTRINYLRGIFALKIVPSKAGFPVAIFISLSTFFDRFLLCYELSAGTN